MTPIALSDLVSGLISVITTLSGYSAPAWQPDIHRVPRTQIQQMVCDRPCATRAAYIPHLGIFIDSALDVENDRYARSILLHELVHHAQTLAARFDSLDPCEGWNAAESEAYEVQDKYLQHRHAAIRYARARLATCSSAQ